MAGVMKGIFSGISNAARGIGTGMKSVGSAVLKPISSAKGAVGSIRTVKAPKGSGGRSFKLRKSPALTNVGTGKRAALPDKYGNLRGTFNKGDRQRAKANMDARRAKASANSKPKKLKRLPPGTTYTGKPGDRKKLKRGDHIKLKPKGRIETPKPDHFGRDKPSHLSKGHASARPGSYGAFDPSANGMPAGGADPYAGMSPQQMQQAGFSSAQEFAQDAERKARSALRSTPAARPDSLVEKGRYGMKTPDFSLNIGGRNRLDPEDRAFINEQRDKTHRHKREQFEWEQAPKDRKANRHWNLINTGKIIYKDGRANSDAGTISRELHRDRSLESFERKFNRTWQNRMQTSYYSSMSPAQQEAARADLYDRMRRKHDRSYSFGRAFSNWRAERKADKRQRKEDARNLKNIRMIRGWY